MTAEQKLILNSFSCERLTFNENNKSLISDFNSERGHRLVWYLKELAWQEDTDGKTAFYIVKDSNGNPVLFFSLKCGTLFIPINEDRIDECLTKCKEIESITGMTLSEIFNSNPIDIFQRSIEQVKTSPSELLFLIHYIIQNKDYITKVFGKINDKNREGDRPINRVHKTLPGIELVHFCVNDVAKEAWKELDFRFSMGEFLFWKFIVPIIEQIQELVGCQYLFLFAADQSCDYSLLNYYQVTLKFSIENNIGTNKPSYDFFCDFMSQEINTLKQNRDEFFNNLDIESEDDLV